MGTLLLAAGCRQEFPAAAPEGVVRLSETDVDFGESPVGVAVQRTITVSNSGTTEVRLTGVTRDGTRVEAFAVSPDHAVLAPAGQLVVALQFKPLEAGDARANLRLELKGAPPQALTVRGRGVVAPCGFEPSGELVFPATRPGELRRLSAYFHNRAAEPTLVQVEAMLPGPFRFNDGTILGAQRINGRSSLGMQVVFEPREPGAFVGELAVNSACGRMVLKLRGRSVPRLLQATPERLDFGFIEPGVTVHQKVRLENVGDEKLIVDTVRVLGTNPFAAPPHAARELVPGAAMEVDVAFAPSELGAFAGRLQVKTTPDELPRLELELKGHGGGPRLELTPAVALDFGRAAVGVPQHREVVLRNVGTDVPNTEDDNLRLQENGVGRMPVVIDDAEGAFTAQLPTVPTTGAQAGAAATVPVRFHPTSPGRKTAKLVVWSNDPLARRVELPLVGEAEVLPPCTVSVNPGSLAFGLVEPGHG
ncbi:MAG: choice-of-anchor D domain-containing protein, partial [Myxococcales bacterium]